MLVTQYACKEGEFGISGPAETKLAHHCWALVSKQPKKTYQ